MKPEIITVSITRNEFEFKATVINKYNGKLKGVISLNGNIIDTWSETSSELFTKENIFKSLNDIADEFFRYEPDGKIKEWLEACKQG